MGKVYEVHAALVIRTEDVLQFCEEGEFPAEIADVEVEEYENHARIKSIPASDGFGKYTPTAYVKGFREERNVTLEDGEPTHTFVSEMNNYRDWYEGEEPERGVDWDTVEYLCFRGKADDVLCNTALRPAMLDFLRSLIRSVGGRGHVQGIIAEDGELMPIRTDKDGDVKMKLSIQEAPDNDDEEEGDGNQNSGDDQTVAWTDNKFISN